MHIKIKKIEPLETYGVRHAVLRTGRPIEECKMEGDDLKSTIHLGAYRHDKQVGVATFLDATDDRLPIEIKNAGACYQLRGMGVAPDQQGNGIGKKLIKQGISMISKNGAKVLWFNARENAVPFYKSIGAVIIGTSFEVPDIGTHYFMYMSL